MVKNDYRRSFIMLRPTRQGFGGHIRLEKRALTANMYFIVNAPEGDGTLVAALAGQRDGQYYAAPLGALARDRRGQLTLASQFDPRAIDARPLEAYAWVAVAERGEGCSLVLVGNVDGSREVDPQALERAVCALFAPPREEAPPAADLPEPGDLPAPEPAPEDITDGDVKIYTRARTRAQEAVPANAEVAAESAEPAPAEPEPAPNCATPPTAAQALGLEITAPWIAPAEGLRRLFATQAPADTPLADGYTYVLSAAPTNGGFDLCPVGLKARDGEITAIRYAVPGRYAPEPPAGLEDYSWNGAGYWVLDIGVS